MPPSIATAPSRAEPVTTAAASPVRLAEVVNGQTPSLEGCEQSPTPPSPGGSAANNAAGPPGFCVCDGYAVPLPRRPKPGATVRPGHVAKYRALLGYCLANGLDPVVAADGMFALFGYYPRRSWRSILPPSDDLRLVGPADIRTLRAAHDRRLTVLAAYRAKQQRGREWREYRHGRAPRPLWAVGPGGAK